MRSISAVISSSERSRKARAAESCASACATCDWIRWLSRKVRAERNGTLSCASRTNASSVLRAIPIATPAKARRVELEAAKTIEQTGLAPRAVVARRRMPLRHKEVLDREAVAAGALETDHMPDVGHPGTRFREQHRAHDRAAVGVEARGPVGLDNRDMAAEPSRVVAAAGKAPGRRD